MFDLILILKCNRVNVYDGVPFGILYVGPGWKYPQYSLSKSVANLFLSLSSIFLYMYVRFLRIFTGYLSHSFKIKRVCTNERKGKKNWKWY